MNKEEFYNRFIKAVRPEHNVFKPLTKELMIENGLLNEFTECVEKDIFSPIKETEQYFISWDLLKSYIKDQSSNTTNSEQLDDADDMDSFMSLIPESGEYSPEEVKAVKNDNEPIMKQKKAECSADSLFNLANDIDFKMLMKDVNEDIKSSREHRSNIWRSAKKDEYQNHIKELQSKSNKEEIIDYIINTINEKDSRTLINSLDEIYYKITMGIAKKNQDRITNVYYKNIGDFEIHQSTLDEFVA